LVRLDALLLLLKHMTNKLGAFAALNQFGIGSSTLNLVLDILPSTGMGGCGIRFLEDLVGRGGCGAMGALCSVAAAGFLDAMKEEKCGGDEKK